MPAQLYFEPALSQPDLVPPATMEILNNWSGVTPVEEILVTPIDPDFAGSAKFCEHYDVDHASGANCVIVEAVRGGNRALAACLIPVNCRADLNKTARKTLGARRVSFAPLEEVLKITGMEYGGISPLGLPINFTILIDSRITAMDCVIVGGGYRKSKLSISGKALLELPNAISVEGLGIEISE